MTRASIADRFWSKVEKTDTCWLWTASKFHDGYGQFNIGGIPRRAHRVAYELVNGPIPHGLVIDHLCRDHACVRPDHLEPVTNAENTRRGVGPTLSKLRRNTKTHCVNGHEFNDDTTYIRSNGLRECRTCRNAASSKRRTTTQGATS